MKKKTKQIVPRDYHQLSVIKGESNCRPKVVKSKKLYTRKQKHKGGKVWDQ